MLRAMLAGQGRVHAAEASYNNHWGVPLTLARMPADAEFAVLEIGMNRPGEIAPLSRLARPHVAMITIVAAAHLEAFEDLDGIAREKAAIFEGLEPGGTAILNADLATTPILQAAAERARARVVRFGEAAGAHHRVTQVTLAGDRTVVEGRAWRTPLLFKIGASGRHFAVNAIGALAVVQALGADRAQAICALGAWAPPGGRGVRETVTLDIVEDHLTIELLDDAFNANPASMAAALETLAAIEPRNGVGRVAEGRRIAILGDMLELGSTETRLHEDLALHPAMAAIARVHCVGPRMRALHAALPAERRGEWAEAAETLARRAATLVDAGDVVLVKGSKGSRVSLVVDALRKLGHPAPNHRGRD
jgi:UDP-N-acetylmuramoyl-tripeptide--D-alanyl-D-alanine ligase